MSKRMREAFLLTGDATARLAAPGSAEPLQRLALNFVHGQSTWLSEQAVEMLMHDAWAAAAPVEEELPELDDVPALPSAALLAAARAALAAGS